MKAKVIINNEDFNREFKVRRMNFEEIIIRYPVGNGSKSYKYNEVELISDGDIDDFLIDNRTFLQIKLNRGISVLFYEALKKSIEEEVNKDLIDFNLLKDKYNVNRKGIWNKEIVCFINNEIPLLIQCSGRNFRRDGYSISISRIEKKDFLISAKEDIDKLTKEIDRRKLMIERYWKALEDTELEKREELVDLM